MKIIYDSKNIFQFIKDYIANFLSYELNVPFTKPWRINFDITYKCPLKCKMCNIWKLRKNEKELSFQELRKIVDEAREWGINHISLAGGEVLSEKEKSIKLIEYALSKGMRVDLITNGYYLDKKTSEMLLKMKINKISLSVDGAKKETHDFIRGKGTFERVMRTAKLLKKLKSKMNTNTELEFTTVIMGYNFRELVEIFYLMRRLGFDYITYQVVTPDNSFTSPLSYYENFYKSDFWIKKEEIPELEKIVKRLIALKKLTGQIRNTRGYLKRIPEYFKKKRKFYQGKCIVGFSYLNIDPYGNINLCGLGPNLNVKKMSLKKIYYSNEFKKTRTLIKHCKRPCLMLCYDKLNFFELLEAWLEVRGWI